MKIFSMIGLCLLATTAAFSQSPTLSSLKGTYVFTQQGNVQSNQSITGLGVMTLDGSGNITCNETLQVPGANVISNCSGKYYLNFDGSGVIEITYDSMFSSNPLGDTDQQLSTAKFKFYVANGGKQLRGIRTENGVFVIASFEKN